MAFNHHRDPHRRVALNLELVIVSKNEDDLPDGNEVAERVLSLMTSNNGHLKVRSKVKEGWVATSVLVHQRHTTPEVCARLDAAIGALQSDLENGCAILEELKGSLDPVNHG